MLKHKDRCLTEKVLAAAKARAGFVILGVDLRGETERSKHAELFAVIDCNPGAFMHWTGKSYPAHGQKDCMVQVVDINSHFPNIADERVLVLACHDLTMYSARAHAT